jgi:hypothetical protein
VTPGRLDLVSNKERKTHLIQINAL